MTRGRALAALAIGAVLLGAGCSTGGDTESTGSTPKTTLAAAPGGSGAESVDGDTDESVVPTEAKPTDLAGEDVQSLPEGAAPEVLGPIGQTELEFETEDGVVQIGVAEVPAEVSSTFPVPTDLVVQISSTSGSEAGFSGVSELSFDELVDFFNTELPLAGYTISEDQLVAGVVAVYDFDGPDGNGQIAISSAPSGGRSVLVTFQS